MSQWISNSFQLPNALVDSGVLSHLKGSSLAMYIFIVRKTRGWQKESDSISISQFVEFTGYGKDAVLSGADKLVGLGLIKRAEYQNRPALYTLNDLPDDVVFMGSEKTTAEKPHADKTTGGVGKSDKLQSENPTHNNNYKTTIKNNTKETSSENSVDAVLNLWTPDLHSLNSWLQRAGVMPMTQELVNQVLLEVNAHYGPRLKAGLINPTQMYANFVKWMKRKPTQKQNSFSEKQNTRNVNQAWGGVQEYAPAIDDVDLEGML